MCAGKQLRPLGVLGCLRVLSPPLGTGYHPPMPWSNALRRLICVAMTGAMVLMTADTRAQGASPPDGDSVLRLFRSLVDDAFAKKANGELEEALSQFQLALAAIRAQRGEAWDKRRYGVMFQRIRILMALKRFKEAGNQVAMMRELPGLTETERRALHKTGQQIDQLRKEQIRRRPVSVFIVVKEASGGPIAATVRVSGEAVGRAPVNLTRVPGRYPIVVELQGYKSHQGILSVTPDKAARTTIVLERLPEPKPPEVDYLPAFATGGAGLGLIVIGGVLHGLAHANYTFADAPGTFRPDAVKAVDQGDHLETAAIAAYGVGGAVLLTAVIIAAVASESSSVEETTTFQLRPSSDAVFIEVGGRW